MNIFRTKFFYGRKGKIIFVNVFKSFTKCLVIGLTAIGTHAGEDLGGPEEFAALTDADIRNDIIVDGAIVSLLQVAEVVRGVVGLDDLSRISLEEGVDSPHWWGILRFAGTFDGAFYEVACRASPWYPPKGDGAWLYLSMGGCGYGEPLSLPIVGLGFDIRGAVDDMGVALSWTISEESFNLDGHGRSIMELIRISMRMDTFDGIRRRISERRRTMN